MSTIDVRRNGRGTRLPRRWAAGCNVITSGFLYSSNFRFLFSCSKHTARLHVALRLPTITFRAICVGAVAGGVRIMLRYVCTACTLGRAAHAAVTLVDSFLAPIMLRDRRDRHHAGGPCGALSLAIGWFEQAKGCSSSSGLGCTVRTQGCSFIHLAFRHGDAAAGQAIGAACFRVDSLTTACICCMVVCKPPCCKGAGARADCWHRQAAAPA